MAHTLAAAVTEAVGQLNDSDRAVIRALLTSPEQAATAGELRSALHLAHVIQVSSALSRFGKAVKHALGGHPDGLVEGEYQWWHMFAYGSAEEGRGFVWRLRPETVSGLRIAGLDSSDRPDFAVQGSPDKCEAAPQKTRATHHDIHAEFEAEVLRARALSDDELAHKLANAPALPTVNVVEVREFVRNPYVVEAVLRRAAGRCEQCRAPAPFYTAVNPRPYLEVHHRRRLADGGEDTVENAVAVCPNCHRKAHLG